MKTYSNKSNARRAARKVFASDELFTLIQNAEDKWTFIEADVEAAVQAIDEPVVGTYSHCPHCQVHLDNGVSTWDYQDEMATRDNTPSVRLEKEFVCLGCGNEFGETVKISSAKPSTKGLKIQKDREEKNGIKRPSVGGKCAAVWEKCEELHGEKGIVPTPKALKAWCEENGHNINNASIELYRWRTWMGFKGRK